MWNVVRITNEARGLTPYASCLFGNENVIHVIVAVLILWFHELDKWGDGVTTLNLPQYIFAFGEHHLFILPKTSVDTAIDYSVRSGVTEFETL
jgi:hypothetical protein